jgi:hypothetical protein
LKAAGAAVVAGAGAAVVAAGAEVAGFGVVAGAAGAQAMATTLIARTKITRKYRTLLMICFSFFF